MAVHMAVINVHPHVVQWWLANTKANSGPRAIELKAHFVPLLMHAIDYDLGAALHRWIDYGLPVSRLDDCNTNRDVLHQSVFRKAWTVLDWWVRARSLGIVYPVADFDPHPYPVVNALECGEEGVFEWWVGPARLPVPEGLDDRILDAASAGGLPKVLEWWAANRGITRYSVVAMDLASFGTPIRWADRPESFYFWYPSISADRRIAVLDWWRNKSGVPLKYSSDLALTMFEQTGKLRTRVTGKPSVVEVLIPVLQWWLQSGLQVDWKTNARPERWDPQLREWWEREYLKLKGPAINADKKAAVETKKKSVQYSVSVEFARMTGGF
ncbi:hypothetical protein BCR44DRAFT_1438593 [Catenaria anguillulae PL171]|uniref:Uncharacterized protein n=1 Tax=Catenaria anguillulae PL171 TaxID=765915 RepID=A0A1Y2HF77_9FUNG|nr:hypothetical protein BCR44DRAFT_1438593 [Catenaria anguillulae PL171]